MRRFKYLGTEEGDGIDSSQVKDKLVKEYYVGSGKFSRQIYT